LPQIDELQYGGFIRGFIDCVSAPGDVLARNFAAVVDCVPLRKLTLDGYFSLPGATTLTESQGLNYVVELELTAYALTSPSILRRFARRGPWPNLRQFAITMYQPGGYYENAAWQRVWEEFRGAFGDRLTTRRNA
jgi:hypothetical protein